jgi:hypothetical protein
LRASTLPLDSPKPAGMTASLAALAVEHARRSSVFVICSHPSSCQAFQRACGEQHDPTALIVDTLSGHLARLMRADSASSGAAPNFLVGGPAAGRALVAVAARGMLDLSWEELRDGSVGVDVPYARRVSTLLDESAALIEWLRRNRVTPAAFRAACEGGVREFYGADVEDARIRLADPDTVRRASRRAREALRVSEEILRVQRGAERDLGVLLARLYEEYLAVERHAAVKSEAGVIDSGIEWLTSDASAAQRAFRGVAAIIVDDAEDAEPALPDMLAVARSAGVDDVIVAGRDSSAIDHLGGRRACSPTDSGMAPFARALAPHPSAWRFADESAESDFIARAILDLIASGVRPDDIAVLGRDDDASHIYATLLAERGVPVLPPSSRFAAAADIADLFALARVCDDPFDQAHLLRVLASPLAGLSDASLFALCSDPAPQRQLTLEIDAAQPARGARSGGFTRLAENVLSGAADIALPEETRSTMSALRERMATWRTVCARLAPPDALRYLIADAGFEARWRLAQPHVAKRLAADASRLVHAFDAAWSSGACRNLSQAVGLIEDGVVATETATRIEGAVACEGVIAVKGARFAHVFVAGVARERFPRVYIPRALAFSRTFGVIARDNVATGPNQTAKFAWYYAKFGAKRRYLEGERRVLGYATSRAIVSATVTGFGKAPFWAADEDLLAKYLHDAY